MAIDDSVVTRFAALVEDRLYSPDVVQASAPFEGTSLESMLAAVPATVGGLAQNIRWAEEIAAVSGAFDPDTIPLSGLDREAVLSALCLNCTIDRRDGKTWWLLNKPIRRTALRRLFAEQRLASTLDAAPPPTDGFGRMLRELLRHGSSTSCDGLKRQDLLDLILAIETVGDVLPAPRLDPESVRARLPKTTVLDEYTSVVHGPFVGRTEELEQLEAFLRGADTRNHRRKKSPAYLVVSGLGGAGKSALLATFARRALEKKLATIVVLDFDRPGIDASDQYWLTLELARQVGQQRPEAESGLRREVDALRSLRATSAFNVAQTSSASDSFERSFYVILNAVANALRQSKAEVTPLLIMLDTFEEVVQAQLVQKAWNWIAQLEDALYGIPIRIVFSGRLFEAGLNEVMRIAGGTPIMIDDLDRDLAFELLTNQGLATKRAMQVSQSQVIPRRPLELTLLARLLVDDTSLTIESIEDSLRNGGPHAGKLFAGIVYRRVLRRLKHTNPIVREIAYPGLILRYVNTDLIRAVVGPALGMRKLTPAESKRAIDALATYEWLAYRDSNGNVWHRKDMRRAMLALMLSENPAKARRLSKSAIKYFRKLKGAVNDAEAIYHELLLLTRGSVSVPPLDRVRNAVSYIGVDASDLPAASQSLIALATGRTLTPEIAQNLPLEYRVRAVTELGEKYVRDREFGNALKLAESLPKSQHRIPFWVAETLFATATWAPLASRRPIAEQEKADDAWRVAVTIFPKAVVSPRCIDWEVAASALRRGPDRVYVSAQPLERIAAAGIILRRVPIRMKRYLTALAADKPDVRRSTQMYARRVAQLGAKYGLHRPLLSIGPATVRLDVRWLREAKQFAANAGTKRYLGLLLSTIARFGKLKTRNTARHFLTKIDTLKVPRATSPLQLRFPAVIPVDERFKFARGPDTEFRDPVRFALLEAFPGEDGLRSLSDIFREAIRLPLNDLEPDSFVRLVSPSPEHELALYVELADRLGMLGNLLHSASERRPDGPKLGKVYKAWRRWNNALRGAYGQRPVERTKEFTFPKGGDRL